MIDRHSIRHASRVRTRIRKVIRYWTHIILQTVICVTILLVAVWAIFAISALLHPVAYDYNIQLPTR